MGKKYFAEYVPEEGEVKEGDKAGINSIYGRKFLIGDVIGVEGKSVSLSFEKGYHAQTYDSADVKKVKLSFCSRDVQVGDKIKAYREIGNEPGFPNSLEDGLCTEVNGDYITYTGGWQPKIYIEKKWCFKVIGQTSPNSTWVKRGNEFDEDDFYYYLYDNELKHDVDWFNDAPSPRYSIIVEVKCPNCKQFHQII